MAILEYRHMCVPQINGVLDLPRGGQYLKNEVFLNDLKQWDIFVDRLTQGEAATPPEFHQSVKEEPPKEQLPPNSPAAEDLFHKDFQLSPDVRNFPKDPYIGVHALVASWESQFINAPAPNDLELLAYGQSPELGKTLSSSGITPRADWFHHDQLAAIIDEWALHMQGSRAQLGLWSTGFVNGQQYNNYYLTKWAENTGARRLWIALEGRMSETPEYIGLLRNKEDVNYDDETQWIKTRFEWTEEFFGLEDAKLRPLATCDQIMEPDVFVRRVGELGMRNDILAARIPPKPRDTVDQAGNTEAYRKWRNFLKPIGLCDKTWDQLVPLKPDPSWEWEYEKHYDLALKNWRNFFTGEEILFDETNRFPLPQRPPYQPGFLKTLAEIGKVLESSNIEAKTATEPFLKEAQDKQICLPQVKAVIDIPLETGYTRKEEWQSDLKLWKEFVGRLERGEEAQPPRLHQTIPHDQPQTSSGEPPNLAGTEAKALFKSDFPTGASLERVPGDGLCGLSAIVLSWHAQIGVHKPPTMRQLQKMAKDKEVISYMRQRGVKVVETWFDSQQLAAMINLWSYRKYGKLVKLGIRVEVDTTLGTKFGYQIEDHVSTSFPLEEANSALRLWIRHNGQDTRKAHYDALKQKRGRAKRVENGKGLELRPVSFALSNSTLVSTNLATVNWGTLSASSPAFARMTISSTTLKTVASNAASATLKATPNA
ncbi:hypothetical protein H2200_013479 [Cladophialophora chaetospira]|uniref:OTU domain-containing protein n=1 Tax=Cladophialophora chaetospira TaxID=386627 RepID=A0AA38TXR2_9EURO|nr:hypothetical protein H2200_013479 [Cladophialophora chaetospira]